MKTALVIIAVILALAFLGHFIRPNDEEQLRNKQNTQVTKVEKPIEKPIQSTDDDGITSPSDTPERRTRTALQSTKRVHIGSLA